MKKKCQFFLTFACFLFACNNTEKGGKIVSKDSTIEQKAYDSYKTKNHLKAKLYFDTLIMKDPGNADYYYKRAYSASFLQTDILSSIEDYKKAISLNYKKRTDAYYNMAVLFESVSQYDSALLYLDECLKIDSLNIEVLMRKNDIIKGLKKSL